jgi:hypothetical protein
VCLPPSPRQAGVRASRTSLGYTLFFLPAISPGLPSNPVCPLRGSKLPDDSSLKFCCSLAQGKRTLVIYFLKPCSASLPEGF